MYGLDPLQFKTQIVIPVCRQIDGQLIPAAISLVLGTCLKESLLTFLVQLSGGPALGVGQMEPATHDDIWRNYLPSQPELKEYLHELQTNSESTPQEELIFNLRYAVAMVRVHYKRVRAPLPPNIPIALCEYWKRWYNTPLGKGTVDEALKHFEYAVKV